MKRREFRWGVTMVKFRSQSPTGGHPQATLASTPTERLSAAEGIQMRPSVA